MMAVGQVAVHPAVRWRAGALQSVAMTMARRPIDDSWYRRTPDAQPRTSAGGVIARVESDRVLVALAREGDFESLVLPKGGVDPGESLVEAAKREIEEEIGISDLTCLAPLGARQRLSYAKDRWVTTHYFLFFTRQIDATPTHHERHWHGPKWLDLHNDQALAEMFWPEQREVVVSNRPMIESLAREAAARDASP